MKIELVCINSSNLLHSVPLKMGEIYVVDIFMRQGSKLNSGAEISEDGFYLSGFPHHIDGDGDRIPCRADRFAPLHYNASAISELLEERKAEKG